MVALCLLVSSTSELHAGRLVAGTIGAQATGTGTISVIPGGAPLGVRLRSQTLDVMVIEAAGEVWADSDLRVMLRNPSAEPVVLRIGIGGPQTQVSGLPEIVEATVGGQALALTPFADADRPQIAATATITLPVRSNASMHIRYRQALGSNAGSVTYTYPLTAGNAWAGSPESLVVSIHFARPLSPEQILHVSPGHRSPRPGAFTWEWSGVKAPSDIGLAFMSSSWWALLARDRTAASGAEIGLAEHVALGERYWHLATLAAPAFAPRATLFDHYFPLAIAEYRAGISAPGTAAGPAAVAEARERLAGFYLSQGTLEGETEGRVYLQLAVGELAAAVELNPEDAELRSAAAALQIRLSRVLGSDRNQVSAGRDAAQLQALTSGRAAPAADELARSEALALAESAVAAGDLGAAPMILNDAFGTSVLHLDGAEPSRITQSQVYVRTLPGQRTISLHVVDAADGADAEGVIAGVVTSLSGLAQVKSDRLAVTITLPYSGDAELLALQERLKAALPVGAELALLSSALTSPRLALPIEAGRLMSISHYEEQVDLGPSQAAWNEEALKFERAASDAEQSSERIARLRAAIWRHEARGWRDLAGRSIATYEAELREHGTGPEWLLQRVGVIYQEGSVHRVWVVRAGDTRWLEASILSWRYDRLALLVSAALILGFSFLAGVWLLMRHRRGVSRRTPSSAADPVDAY